MNLQKFLTLSIVTLICLIPTWGEAQNPQIPPPLQPATVVSQDIEEVREAGDNKFHRNVIRAARNLNRSGEITRAQLLGLRVRMMSPAFRKHCEDLAVTQMYYSGDDGIPLDGNGRVQRASIDWDALLAFIEKLIPIILQLIDALGVMLITLICSLVSSAIRFKLHFKFWK